MLILRYSKTNGAEFISHLDTLRHIQKTLLRAGVEVKLSQGYNPHMLVYMSAPLGIGITSLAEYCAIDTTFNSKDFCQLFNQFAPFGLRAVNAVTTDKKVNLQNDMNSAEYLLKGIYDLDIPQFLGQDGIYITDKKGEKKEVKDRIISLKNSDNGLIATLLFGNYTLRPDHLAQSIYAFCGKEPTDIQKLNAYINGKLVEDAYL